MLWGSKSKKFIQVSRSHVRYMLCHNPIFVVQLPGVVLTCHVEPIVVTVGVVGKHGQSKHAINDWPTVWH